MIREDSKWGPTMKYTKRQTFHEGGEAALAYNMRSIGKALAGTALAAALGLGLSGCGTSGNPGAAFVVNDQAFKESALTQTIEEFAVISGSEIPRNEMVSYLVLVDLRLQSAEAAEVEFTDEDVKATLDAALAEVGTTLTAEQISRPVLDSFRDGLLINMVQSGEISAEEVAVMEAFIVDSSVVVNPRYGSYTDGTVTPPAPLGDAITKTLTDAVS